MRNTRGRVKNARDPWPEYPAFPPVATRSTAHTLAQHVCLA